MTRNHLATTALERFLHSSPSRHLSKQNISKSNRTALYKAVNQNKLVY